MAGSLFRTKSIDRLLAEAGATGERTLKRTLGGWSLVALGIGGIIGAGIFVRTAAAIAERSGPSVTLAFVVAAVGCLFAGLCYAEFASMIPIAGSAYTYSYATMGEFVAWIIGWDLVLEYAVGAATVAIAWSEYFNRVLEFLGFSIPYQWRHSPFESMDGVSGHHEHSCRHHSGDPVGPADSRHQGVGVRQHLDRDRQGLDRADGDLDRLAVHQPGESHPIHPGSDDVYERAGSHTRYGGLMGILGAAGVVFFAFIGFDAVSTAAQETKNPKKDMPFGILGSLVVCTVLYVLFAYVLSGVATVEDFRTRGRGGVGGLRDRTRICPAMDGWRSSSLSRFSPASRPSFSSCCSASRACSMR